jgi:two-component system sensor histidine kinase PilS (NtrC family)
VTDAAILLPPGSGAVGQNQLLFRIYLLYRILLSVIFLVLLSLPATRQLVGSQDGGLYLLVTVVFLISNVALLGANARRVQRSEVALVAMFGFDIVCITAVSDASGGMSSGLPLLLTITIASSAVLISKRSIATLVAALAVLATLADTLRLISLDIAGTSALFPAGLLGLLFFGVSLIVQIVAARLGRAETIALERAGDLYRLQRLKERIVQNMQTGILTIDAQRRTRILNGAAGRLLDPTRPLAIEQGRDIGEYSPKLAERLETFRRSGLQRGSPFMTQREGAQVVARFQSLEGEDADQTLVFLEDYRPVAAYAQSLKLTSLGRLAASIAHEVRNPLGAISHAAQLLAESPTLDAADQKLIRMILTNSQRVDEIVESVMQISRREPPKTETLRLVAWMDQFRQRYAETREETGRLIIEYVDPSATILFDPEHLDRVLGNLVDNAMRHGCEKTGHRRAEIRVRVAPGHNECIIEVYDQGSGVARADIGRLFEPFFTRSAGGSGLGLYVCRELCELNQARISYAPTTDGRSRFQINIQQQE